MSIVGTAEGSDIVDIPIYHYTHSQPPGRSIVWLDPNQPTIDETHIDWMRIVAVYVDEPYNNEINDGSTFCSPQQFQQKWNKLQNWAALIRQKAPTARFWVNFRQTDIDLINGGCALNGAYIDVISMDIYYTAFAPNIRGRYDALYNHRASAHQQFALVPGTFTGGNGNQSGSAAAGFLSGYFDYASEKNEHCELGLGSMGRTGIYDGCLVWMVAGWFGGTVEHRDSPNGPAHYPIDHALSTVVRNAWQSAFAVRRVDPARLRQAIKAIPLLEELAHSADDTN